MIVLLLGLSSVFAGEDEQEPQELCDGVPELEAQAFLLEQSIIAAQKDGADVDVPLPESSSEMEVGEIPSCDEITELLEDRIEQLEAYIDDNGVELLDEDMEEIKEKDDSQKQEKESDDQLGNDVSASVSQGMPSCEQNTMLLGQRIADLEQFIEDNGLDVPELTEEEKAAMEEAEEASEKEAEQSKDEEEGSYDADDKDAETDQAAEQGDGGLQEQKPFEQQVEDPKQGFIKGMFKKMFGFFGGSEGSQEQPPMMEEQGEEEPKKETEGTEKEAEEQIA